MLDRSTHVSLIPVKNMSRAIRFYTNVLGANVNMRGSGEMKGWWASISFGKSEIWLIRPDKVEGRKLAYNVFTVKNIKSNVNKLKNKVKFQPAEEQPGAKIVGPISYSPYGASAFFPDSEGNLLMLFQAPKM